MASASVVARDDAAGVEAAARDYFEGWFEGDAARMERALHPTLVKRSLLDDGSDMEEPQTAEDMIRLTRAGLGTRYDAEQRTFDIEVVDVYEGIASVIVRSAIYREYLHVARVADEWKIVHALWLPTRTDA